MTFTNLNIGRIIHTDLLLEVSIPVGVIAEGYGE